MADKKRTSNDTPLKELVDRWFKAHGLDERRKELEIVQAWPELMGTAVAHRTKKLTIRNKVLYVKMESSVLRDELAHGKQIIIQRVNEFARCHMIEDVWFG